MLRNKEPELAEKIDSLFGCFDLGFYRVNFVFGSRHLIIVLLLSDECCDIQKVNNSILINISFFLKTSGGQKRDEWCDV